MEEQKILNPKTGRSVKANGMIGKKIQREQQENGNPTDEYNVDCLAFDKLNLNDTKKGKTCKPQLLKTGRELFSHEVLDAFEDYKRYVMSQENRFKVTGKKLRTPNFPSEISENMLRFVLINKERQECVWNISKGDLLSGEGVADKITESKAFASEGPISFGPTETWQMLYLIDAIEFRNDMFKVYRVDLPYEDFANAVIVNKNQTFKDQCLQKRRPRVGFGLLQQQLGGAIVEIFSGSVYEMLELPNESLPSAA